MRLVVYSARKITQFEFCALTLKAEAAGERAKCV